MNYFVIKERSIKDVIVLDIYGSLKGCGGRIILRDAVCRFGKEEQIFVILNFMSVCSLDSSCLGELVSCHFRLKNKGGRMKIVRINERVRQIITMTNLLDVFDIYDDEGEAFDSFLDDTLEPEQVWKASF